MQFFYNFWQRSNLPLSFTPVFPWFVWHRFRNTWLQAWLISLVLQRYFHLWRYYVYARKLTWYFTGCLHNKFIFKVRFNQETNLMQLCSANQHQVILPSWLPKVPSWLRKQCPVFHPISIQLFSPVCDNLHNELNWGDHSFLQIYCEVINIRGWGSVKYRVKNAFSFSGPTPKLMRLTFPKSKTLAGGWFLARWTRASC